MNRTRRADLFIPQSENVTYSNLRQVLLALANPATPPEYRRRFYRCNPIPGAIWAGDPLNPVLINADEIMPDGYNINMLRGDIEDIKYKFEYLVRKAPKPFKESLNWEYEGTKAMLTSNEQGDLTVQPRNANEALADYTACFRLDGDIQSYWNLEKLNYQEMINGSLCLLGELSNNDNLRYPVQAIREERWSTEISSAQYRATVIMKYT